MRAQRFDFAPVERLYLGDDADIRHASGLDDWEPGRVLPVYLSEMLGVGRQTIHRWRKDGLARWRADAVAAKVGVHPCELWPHFHDDIDVSDVLLAA